jgi:Ca2+-binding EF-hand superfamily protein
MEHALIKICEKEIQSVRKVEVFKQQLMSLEDFSMLEIFRHMDKFAHGNINCDNLRVFMRNFDFCADLEEEDLQNWIRRYDRDVDSRLDFADFVKAMGPYCQYTQKAEDIQNSPPKKHEDDIEPEDQMSMTSAQLES